MKDKDYTWDSEFAGYVSMGSTHEFAIVQIKDKFFIEDIRGEDLMNAPRLPLIKELANLYINQLQAYLDQDPDNQESERLYNGGLFNNMCIEYFKENAEEKRILDSI